MSKPAASRRRDPPEQAPPHLATFPLAIKGGLTLYEAVYQDLCRRIGSGELPLDSRLPGERELTMAYGVSRVTLRQALEKAEQVGLITRIPGRGTYVSLRRVLGELGTMRSFRVRMLDLDMVPSYAVMSTTWISPAAEIAERLRVAPSSTVLQVDSVGLATRRPMAQYRSVLPREIGEKVLELGGLESRSTYELAADLLGAVELDADQIFEAIRVDPETACRLQVPDGSEAFRVSSVFHAPDHTPVEYRVATYPGGRYSFHIGRTVTIR